MAAVQVKQSPALSQWYRNCPVGSAPAPEVDPGIGVILGMLFAFLFLQAVEESQGDFVPFLRKEKQEETEADDEGGPQADHTENDLALEKIDSFMEGGREKRREELGDAKSSGLPTFPQHIDEARKGQT